MLNFILWGNMGPRTPPRVVPVAQFVLEPRFLLSCCLHLTFSLFDFQYLAHTTPPYAHTHTHTHTHTFTHTLTLTHRNRLKTARNWALFSHFPPFCNPKTHSHTNTHTPAHSKQLEIRLNFLTPLPSLIRNTQPRAHTHTRTHTHTLTDTHTDIHTDPQTHTDTQTRTQTHTNTHANLG